MSLALQDLSPLLQCQGDHLVAGVALEVDFGANGLRDEDIPFDGRECTSSLLMAKASVAHNMTAEKKRSCALMVSRNPSSGPKG